MKMLSYNIRGLGGRVKKSKIRNIVVKENIEFVCIQEQRWR